MEDFYEFKDLNLIKFPGWNWQDDPTGKNLPIISQGWSKRLRLPDWFTEQDSKWKSLRNFGPKVIVLKLYNHFWQILSSLLPRVLANNIFLPRRFLRSESHDAAVANSTDNDNSKDDDGSKVFVPPVFDVKKAKDFGVSNLVKKILQTKAKFKVL